MCADGGAGAAIRALIRLVAVSAGVAIVGFLTVGSDAEAAGTPISACGQTVTASAFLTQDLYCPGSAGIVIGASGVTIDLKGFTLRGDRSSGHYGIDDSGGYDGVTVETGIVRDFDTGVYATDADKVKVSGVVASANTAVGIYVVGASASIKSSSAFASINGIYVVGASASIKSSTASGNPNYGISIQGPSGQVASSTALGNGDGIFVLGDGASVASSTASGNDVFGIEVGAHGARIKGNRAEGNGFAGRASDGHGRGIDVHGYTTAPVGSNTARGNDDPSECSPASLC
jgi:hypothetical protein